MKFSKSQARLLSVLSIGFILGLGFSSGVYWLFISPSNNGQSANTVTLYPTDASQRSTYVQDSDDVVSSSSMSQLPILRRLEDLEEIRSPFQRDLALQVLLAFSDEAHAARLLQQSMNLSPNDIRFNAQNTIIQKLAHLNPRRALSHVLEMDSQPDPNRFVVTVFQEWVQSDLDEAVAQARRLNETIRDSVLRTILEERKDLAQDTRRSIAREFGREQIADEIFKQEMIEEAMDNPEEAWADLVRELQNDSTQRMGLAQVAWSWVVKDRLSVMDQVSISITNLETRRLVLSDILQNVASTNPSGAFRYALTIENDPFNSIIENVGAVWARSDPQSALATVADIKKKTLREELEETIAHHWANEEPRKALVKIDALPLHVQQATTRTALARIAESSPKEAADLVAEMETGATKTFAARDITNVWLPQDMEGTLDWILNEPAVSEMKTFLLEDSLLRVAPINPRLAMDTALSQPIAESETGMSQDIGLELTVIGILSVSDFDSAIELLPEVREGRTTMLAFQAVTGALIRNGEVDEALDMVHQVPQAKRTDFYTGLVRGWAETDPSGLLNSMNRLPSKEVRSKAAMMLLKINGQRENLTDEQVEEARQFLTSEDWTVLEESSENTSRGRGFPFVIKKK